MFGFWILGFGLSGLGREKLRTRELVDEVSSASLYEEAYGNTGWVEMRFY